MPHSVDVSCCQKPVAAWQRGRRQTKGALLRANLQGGRFTEDDDWTDGKRQESFHRWIERSRRPICRRVIRWSSGISLLIVNLCSQVVVYIFTWGINDNYIESWLKWYTAVWRVRLRCRRTAMSRSGTSRSSSLRCFLRSVVASRSNFETTTASTLTSSEHTSSICRKYPTTARKVELARLLLL